MIAKLAKFRVDALLPFSARAPAGSDAYRKNAAINQALLDLADELGGEKDVLITKGHSQPPS